MDELEEMKILQEINDLRSYLRDAKAKTIPDLETNQGQNTADIDELFLAVFKKSCTVKCFTVDKCDAQRYNQFFKAYTVAECTVK